MAAARPRSNGAPGRAPEGGGQGGTVFRGKPLSPWGERFGLADDTFDFGDGRHHTGLAPLYPALDALNYYDVPQTGPVDKPDEAELDRLFLTERYQEKGHMGLKMWQIGALK